MAARVLPWVVPVVLIVVGLVFIDDVLVVSAIATGSTSYLARGVVVRVDSAVRAPAEPGSTLPPAPESDTSTVATCVLWDVDVVARSMVARAAREVLREPGDHVPAPATTLRTACAAVAFG